ncbi:MAG: carboxylating nicotinate-nucleotide diphosphorylase [Firmicutes bacterium]|nr:carboxylating nicotinate-nucleotide diphosphorylase [Bacillota bacterium]
MIDAGQLQRIIKMALDEDVGTGDITTAGTVTPGTQITGRFIAKADGVLCGTEVVQAVFATVDTAIALDFHFRDEDALRKGDVIADIGGDAAHILTGERTALNLLQHMSGIATRTKETVAQVAGYDVRILDTRKTTPGLRVLEKYAVRVGGGYNHRFSLADGILIKDNHIQAAGGITRAVAGARSRAPFTLKIEVETETLRQVQEALDARADIIMLDNMTAEQMREAVALIGGRAVVEASGNMGQRDLREVAATGVDCISVGDLTNDVRPLDISLKLDIRES